MADDVIRNDSEIAMTRPGLAGIAERVSWGAVWAGVMAALGMEVLLSLFGFFIGFRMYHWQAANPWVGISHWSTVWFLVTIGWSMFFGAWCAARLSGNPLPGDGVLHGICTWGLATVATFAILSLASWAVLREGIDVLRTATITVGQVAPAAINNMPPRQAAQATNQAGQAVAQMQANAGPTAQTTATIISRLSLLFFVGILIGFVTAILGGWLGRSRTFVLAAPEIVRVPSPRAA